MAKVLAVDPGETDSAVVAWNGAEILMKGMLHNDDLCKGGANGIKDIMTSFEDGDVFAIEEMQCYGAQIGKQTMDTIFFAGRIWQYFWDQAEKRWKVDLVFLRVPRMDVKMHLCGSSRAKDPDIRRSLIQRFGEPGTKKKQGLLYGVKADEWAALAVAVYVWDNKYWGKK